MSNGVESVYESKQIQRDIRHPLTKFKDFLQTDHGNIMAGSFFIIPFFIPQIAIPTYLCAAGMLLIGRKKFTLPVHLPIFSKEKYDYNNMETKRVKDRNVPTAKPPAGVVYVGNIQSTGEQVWWDKPLCCTHLFFLSTTGGGKTFSFAGILANFIIYSGFCYSDAKAELGLVENFARMMWRMGRINQLYVLSFQSGNRSPWAIRASDRISHTFNPAANGSAPMIAELFKSLLDGDGDIWAKRADNLSTVLVRPLTYMRDKFGWPMGFGQIALFFTLEKLGELCGIGLGRNPAYTIPDDHKKYFRPLVSFMTALPGLTEPDFEGLVSGNKQQIAKITNQVRDQLGFVTMQLVNVTNDLIGDYGHIFETMYGQINLEDGLTNRKVVITLLPALERSESTMSLLGRISLAAQKTIVANAQSFKLGGSLSDHISSRPTAADVPYASVNDEAGSYMVEGVSANTAMARSANVSFWFGGQDLQAMKKRGGMVEKEIDTIWGTTVNKMAGSVLEESTISAFINAADEELRLEATDFEIEDNGMFKRRKEGRVSVQSRKILTPKMLSDQAPGQVQLMTRGKVRAVSLPNYKTPGLNKDVVNFYITETLPIIPMPHEIIHQRKKIKERMKLAIESTEKFNLFQSAIDNSVELKTNDTSLKKLAHIANQLRDQFIDEARFKHLSPFTAQCIVQFYMAEEEHDTLSTFNPFKRSTDLKHLLGHHERVIPKLFKPSESFGQDEIRNDAIATDSIIVDKAQEPELDNGELTDDFYADISRYALDPSNIHKFHAEVDKLLSEDADDSTAHNEVRLSDILSGLDIEDSFNAPTKNKDPEHAKESLINLKGEAAELNLGDVEASLLDIADLLSEKGLGNTAPTLITDEVVIVASEAREQVNNDLLEINELRKYKGDTYKADPAVVMSVLSEFSRMIETDN